MLLWQLENVPDQSEHEGLDNALVLRSTLNRKAEEQGCRRCFSSNIYISQPVRTGRLRCRAVEGAPEQLENVSVLAPLDPV